MAKKNMKDFEQEISESFETVKEVENEDGGKQEHLQNPVESKGQFNVRIIEAMKGDCTAYLGDIRAFIPASQLFSNYVEKFGDYVNKHITVVVITADPEKKRPVLSHRTIEQEEKEKEKATRLAKLEVGNVLDDKVEPLEDYGTFIDFNGATGLLRTSQVSRKRVKAPADVLKEGQGVKAKITKIGNGKISLSMRALEESDDHFSGRNNALEETGGFKYEEKAHVVTNPGDLLKNIRP